jgi:TolA-binding protein
MAAGNQTGKHPAVDPPKQTNWVDLGFKILSLFILPLLAVGLSMWSEQALTRERISNIQREQTQSSSQLETANARINQIALTVQETNGKINELRTILDFIRSQVTNHTMPRPSTGGER